MAGERDYLSRHPTCEMCGTKKAVFVTTGADTAALCYTCGDAYMKKGHAIVEVDRLDNVPIHQRRKVNNMDNLDVGQALAELQAAEREMYWESDKDRADKGDNALQEYRERADNATSEAEALEALQDYEASLYLKEDN